MADGNINVDIDIDTVGQRLLGLALAQMAAGDEASAVKSLEEAIEIHTKTNDWPSLVRIAKLLLGRQEQLTGLDIRSTLPINL